MMVWSEAASLWGSRIRQLFKRGIYRYAYPRTYGEVPFPRLESRLFESDFVIPRHQANARGSVADELSVHANVGTLGRRLDLNQG